MDEKRIAQEIYNSLWHRGVPVKEVGLFGSRAVPEKPSEHSDWDFYALTDEEIPREIRIDVANEVSMRNGLPLPYSTECQFGNNEGDKSQCIDLKLTTVKPITSKPLVAAWHPVLQMEVTGKPKPQTMFHGVKPLKKPKPKIRIKPQQTKQKNLAKYGVVTRDKKQKGLFEEEK